MRSLLSFLLLLTPVAAFADESAAPASPEKNGGPQFEISTGVEYEEGDYGTGTEINILSAPTSLKVATGRLQLVATLPYRRVEGPSNVVPGGVLGLPILFDPNQPQSDNVTREGWGDLEIGASYFVPSKILNMALSGWVKLPTAENNLGTGKSDYTLGAEVSKPLPGGIIPFASVNYTLPGSPEGYNLQDSYAATGGLAAMIGSRTQAYVSYRYADNASELVASDQRLITGLNSRLGKAFSLGLYGSAGMSEGAPEFTTGLRIGVSLN
ncbi:hypothetical protein EKN06_09760 [Croceicoccus ponticola]|uniref:Transporter n=1 Tax=Croceicoccus ponticola TaxID=2217664 RepID=A0A437GYD1_9SPHN|nr:hypothetical protein [Croceicoccus ponticola]RVQ67181.1 hypothetical protein EKN06_09760 [Croceicoccus ponticola]